MTAATDPDDSSGFKLSQLIYDTRYRAITIQVLTVLAVGWMAWELIGNLMSNLAARGKDVSFGFLLNPANYDITESLIPFSSTDTNLRATFVGLLNTLLVAFLGCILALIIGITAGVLRLSNNWIVAKLMTVYVEAFRNIPILLWIIAVFALLTEATPAPSAFRGDDPTSTMKLWDTVAITNRGTYIPRPIFEPGMGLVAIAFVLSIIGAIFFVRWSKKRFLETGKTLPNFWIALAIVFGVTALVFLVMGMPVSWSLPALTGFNFQGGLQINNPFLALWFALSLFTGAFIAEIVRGGILSVSKGQTEAAFALGMRPSKTMNLVILPQALRVIIPPIISQFLNLTKNSSLALAIGYVDLRGTIGGTTMNVTGRELECVILMMAIYLVISLIISSAMNLYNASVKLKER
ncbi:putative glutamine ABC transporter permease protein GlnM [Aquimixticola soesokkakensis]|uniref:Putative glutamine ABC transporter permease protein GlnM n=1 Tax=Aquimixticola soesokkakensis TaxID=1519096 RepID=A0A1Y5T3T0_9RHOB|nr:ABC transporter permease subunit [Aquimixticola soesokkakensis]SLN51674.1 putative glutamine ABC transporter permease protein GlnM [Aquimixticola soesokkakensis]